MKGCVKILLPLFAALLLLSSVGCGGGDMNPSAAPTPADPSSPYLLLVNKRHPLGATHAPQSLAALAADLTLYGKSVELESTAASAAEALVHDLHDHGYTDIVITSGYRTYVYQQSLFNTYMDREQKEHPDWTTAQCREKVLTYSAAPGESEHQTGLCMDLISMKHVVLDESFADNPVYAYLQENAHRFGFVLRYPKGKENTTGYSYEPWHYRYVGVEDATRMHAAGLTLEEYLGA